jgi:hypothetical protein
MAYAGNNFLPGHPGENEVSLIKIPALLSPAAREYPSNLSPPNFFSSSITSRPHHTPYDTSFFSHLYSHKKILPHDYHETWRKHVLSPSIFPYAPSLVCTIWRGVMFLVLDFWKGLVLRVGLMPSEIRAQLQLSRNLPLDIIVTTQLEFESEAEENIAVRAVIDTLAPYLSRFQTIRYDVMSSSSLPSVLTDLIEMSPDIQDIGLHCQVGRLDGETTEDKIVTVDEAKIFRRRCHIDILMDCTHIEALIHQSLSLESGCEISCPWDLSREAIFCLFLADARLCFSSLLGALSSASRTYQPDTPSRLYLFAINQSIFIRSLGC